MQGHKISVHVKLYADTRTDIRTRIPCETIEELRRDATGLADEDSSAIGIVAFCYGRQIV